MGHNSAKNIRPEQNYTCYGYTIFQISNQYILALQKKSGKADLPDGQIDGRTDCKPKKLHW